MSLKLKLFCSRFRKISELFDEQSVVHFASILKRADGVDELHKHDLGSILTIAQDPLKEGDKRKGKTS